MSYLEIKFHLLLQYCIDIAFYLLLKVQGRSVKDHPCIKQLVQIRTIIEKLRPIDKRLKYQIDKMIKMTAASNISICERFARNVLSSFFFLP